MNVKNTEPWKSVIKDLVFDKAVWLFAALCIMGYSYAHKSANPFNVPFEFSIQQMTKDSHRDTKVNQLLLDLLYEANADRAIIMTFHNGDRLAGGTPFKKMSCTYEATKLGVSREITSLQGIPLSSVPECLKELIDHDQAFPIVVDKLPCGPSRALLESQGIRITIRKRLMVNQSILGFIAINYVKSPYVEGTNSELHIQDALNKVNNAAGLLQLEFEKEKGR
jgi:hypothetical protein